MVLLLGAVALPIPARAQTPTLAELQAIIQNLMQQIADLIAQQEGGGSGPTFCILTRDLTVGSEGADVRALETFLNRKGYTVSTSGSGAPIADTLFNANTRDALARYQAVSGVNPASGYLGPITRANINLQLTPADCDTDESENDTFYFRKVENIETTYEQGESISIEAEAVEDDDSSTASQSEGFNVQAYIFRGSNTSGDYLTPSPAGSYNARFVGSEWKIDMDAPNELGAYTLKLTVYCSRPDSDCEEKYGRGGNITRLYPFRVVSDDEEEDVSLDVDLVSSIAEVIDSNTGRFEIVYKISANGGDVYVSNSPSISELNPSVYYRLNMPFHRISGNITVLDIEQGDNLKTLIRDGETKNFRLVSIASPQSSGDKRLQIDSISWGRASTNSLNNRYDNLSNLRTPLIYLEGENSNDPEEEPEVIVTSPGDNSHIYKSGDMMNIVYSLNNFPEPLPRSNIDLYKGNSRIELISRNVDSNGRFSWTLPSNLVYGNDYRILITTNGDPQEGVDTVQGWSNNFTISNTPTPAPAIRAVSIDNYQTPWTNRTAKTIRWNYSDLPQTGLKFKVGLYTNLNGGMWGNSVFVNAVGTSGTLTTSLDPRIGEPYFNKDYFIMVRLYNTDSTEFRPSGRRIETVGSQIFQVVPPTTGMVNKEDQLASIYNTLENMLEGLRK